MTRSLLHPCGPVGSRTASAFSRSTAATTAGALDERALLGDLDGSTGWAAAVDELLRLRGYEDGWDGDGAKAAGTELVDSAIRLAVLLRRQGWVPPSCVVPGVNGTVVLERVGPHGRDEIEIVAPGVAEVTEVVGGAVTGTWELVDWDG